MQAVLLLLLQELKTVLYTCTDAAGNTATQSVSYSVAAPDTTDPVYAGPTRISVIHNSHGGTFNAGASGVQCTDDTDGTVNAVTTHARDFTTRTLSSQYDIRFVCTDAADNSVNFTIRYVIIAQPIVSIAIEDVPSSTNDGSIEVSITFGADVTGFETRDIRVTNNAGHVLSGSGSSYTLTITPTQDGTITVTIPRGAAQAGSAINAVASFSFVSDTKAPAIPTFTTSTVTVRTTPVTLAGTAEADSVVTLYKGETSVATVTATTGGNFEFTGVALTEESNSFTITATDASSNVSVKSGALVITLDTTAPAAPIFTTSAATVSSSPITLAGTAEADSQVTLYKDGSSVNYITDTSGTFEFTGVTLTEGSNSFTVAAFDALFNESPKSDVLVIILDTTDPAFATSTATTDVTFGDTVPTLSTLCTDANTITVTNDAGSATFDAEGAKTVLYTCTDAAGNTATQSVSYSVAAASPSDTLAPAAPIFTNSTTTVSTTPITLAGTAEADSTVELFKGGTSVTTVTATTGGTFEFTGVALTEGINSFTLTATDASSNVSAKSGALVITLDTEAPAIPTYISIASDNTNTSLAVSGDIVTITFDTEEGSIVKGTIGGKNATFTLAGTTGKLAITLDGTETSGVLTFSFVQTDAAGNAAATQTAVKGSAGTGTTVTATVNIDISSTATGPTFLTLIPITVTFSTPVHGFDATDLVITNGELVPSTFSGSGDTYTFNVRPILGLIPHSTNVATSTDVGVYISGSTIFSADGKNTIAQPASFSIGYVVEQLFADSPANVVTTFSILNRNATTVREDVDNTITIYVAADVTTYALELRKGTYSNSQLVDTITYDSSVLTESFQQNNHTRYTIDSHGNIYVAEDQSSQSQINTRLINTVVHDDSSLGYLLEDVSLELGDNTFFLYDRDGVDVSRYFSITVVSIPVFSLPDSDGDGVIDTMDECLNSPSNKAVTASGCPLPEFVSTVPTYERFTMNMLYDHDAKTITASGNAHYLISGVTLLVTYDSAIFTHNQLLGGAFDSDFKTVHANATSVSNLDGTYSFVIEDVYLPGTYLLRVSEVSVDLYNW